MSETKTVLTQDITTAYVLKIWTFEIISEYNPNEDWSSYRERLEFYFEANGVDISHSEIKGQSYLA